MIDPTAKPEEGATPPIPLSFTLRDGRPCTIRAATEDDAAGFCAFLPRTHVETDHLNFLPGEFNKTVEQERQWIREHYAKPHAILLTAVVDGRTVASGGAGSLDLRRYAHHAECGLAVLEEFWGNGIGRRMMELLVAWGRTCKLHKLYLRVFADNARAIELYRSLGFVEEARLPDDAIGVHGGYRDTIIMARYYDRRGNVKR